MRSQPSQMDINNLVLIRENVSRFLAYCGANYCGTENDFLLDVAPQDHGGARPYFPPNISIKTLDIDPKSGCDYVGDICCLNEALLKEQFRYVVCTEVLEHVLMPFDAVREIARILKPGGYVFVTTPFNFRIHGPLPDCWRLTEHGLKQLFNRFDLVELTALESEERSLMPVHYTLVARKPCSEL